MEASPTDLQSNDLKVDNSNTSLLFHRKEELTQLVNRLRSQYLITVSGNAQIGKSTLLRFGLPSILDGRVQGQNGTAWRVATCRPGTDPVENLSRALANPGSLKQDRELEPDYSKNLKETLERDSNGLIKVYEEAMAQTGEKYNLLVIIDRMEDIFRFEKTLPGQNTISKNVDFLSLLFTAVRRNDVAIYVLFNFNHHFVNKAGEYPGLAEAISRSNYPLPDFNHREIIRGLRKVLDYSQPETQKLVLRMSKDIQAQSREPFLLAKVHHALIRTIDYWQKVRKEGEPVGIKHYEAVGSLGESFNKGLEEVFQEMEEEAIVVFEKILRILTQNAGDEVVRRPTSLKEILEHFPDEKGEIALDIIEKCYQAKPRLWDIITPLETLDDQFSAALLPREHTIIDLAQIPLLHYSPKLIALAYHEAHEADIFLRLFDTAKRRKDIELREEEESSAANANANSTFEMEMPVKEDFLTSLKYQFSTLKENIPFMTMAAKNQPQNQPEDLLDKERKVSLYVPPELDFVVKWREEYQPTEVWAKRYYPDYAAEMTEAFKQTPFELSMNFLKESEEAELQKKAREKQEATERERKRNQNQRIIGWFAVMAFVAAIVAGFLGIRTNRSLNNIKLLNYVDALIDAQVLTAGPEEISALKSRIVKDRDIDTKDSVVHYLWEKKVLRFDKEDIDDYYNLFESVDELYGNLRRKGGGEIKKEDIHASANKAIQAYGELYDAGFQFPYVYKVLYAHLEAYKNHSNIGSEEKISGVYYHRHGSLIESLASNPHPQKSSEFAFGDRKGNVFVTTKLDDHLEPNTESDYRITLDEGKNGVSALAYSKSGTMLAAGTSDGTVNRVKVWNLYDSEDMSSLPNTTRITSFAVPDFKKPIQFMAFIHEDKDLLVVAEKKISISDKGRELLAREMEDLISDVALSNDEKLLAIGLPDRAIVFELESINNKYFLLHRETIPLPPSNDESTLSSIAFSPAKDLVMGSETGNIWVVERKDQEFGNVRKLLKVHKSTITNLAFNASGIRLVSSGLDGNMVIWNFDQLNNKNEYIRLREEGNGIWTFSFINEAELIVAENISLRKWYSNVQSLKNELDNYLK